MIHRVIRKKLMIAFHDNTAIRERAHRVQRRQIYAGSRRRSCSASGGHLNQLLRLVVDIRQGMSGPTRG